LPSNRSLDNVKGKNQKKGFVMYLGNNLAKDPESGGEFGTGWLPPYNDWRDYSEKEESIVAITGVMGLTPQTAPTALPANVDLRKWCSPIENQGSLGSCTANAGIGIVEYFERRAHGKHIDGSRLFTYKTTRNLMGVVGDTGAWLRTVMASLVLFGVPPEKYWPYTTNKQPGPAKDRTFDDEPSSFVYGMADNFEALKYFCHDPAGASLPGDKVLACVKKYLAYGIPSMFGFYGFPSFDYGDFPGAIPFPCPGEKVQWGHAIVAVGYDDKKKITNKVCNQTTTGALLIRNSWGTGWGEKGYGWLPYDYVLKKLAVDFWSLLSMGWVNTGQFGLQ
jgi:C1A family cysteine protease